MNHTRRTFLQQTGSAIAGLGLLPLLPGWAMGAGRRTMDTLPGMGDIFAADLSLPRSSPESQDIPSAGLLQFVDAMEQSGLGFHSLMLIRHGHVIAEGWWAPYAAPLKHTLYSASKSFTSTAVGLAIAEGHLSVEDKVISFFRDKLPATVSDHLAGMKVKHLLTMSTGHAQDTVATLVGSADGDWVKTFLSLPLEYAPGEHFLYNTGATFMLSAIVQQRTGQNVFDYLSTRLFEPLGILNADWEMSPKGINTGGWGLRVKTEDLGKLGLLYLQNGQWKGRQVLPPDWVKAATSAQIASGSPVSALPKSENDWLNGYGYQFWRCSHGGFRADGAFGQYSIVLPEHDTVLAVTGESANMQAELTLIWKYLLPVLEAGGKDGMHGVVQGGKDASQLTQRLGTLNLPLLVMNRESPLSANLTGKKIMLDSNALGLTAAEFRFIADRAVLILTDDKGEHSVSCGINSRVIGENEMPGTPPGLLPIPGAKPVPTKVAASATWKDDHTLVMEWRYIETAHYDTVTCVFGDGKVSIQFLNSISKIAPTHPEKRPVLTGVWNG